MFDRHAKGVRLTEVGQMFVRRVEFFQSELRRAREEIDQKKGILTGEVSIALSPVTCMSVMPPAIARFTKRYPEALVKVKESLFQPIETDLANGSIDFWIGPFDRSGASPQFVAERLLDNERWVVGRKGHPLSSARSLHELADAKWVRPAISVQGAESDFDSAFALAGLPLPKKVIHSGSLLISIVTVANTDLLTVMPRHLFQFSPLSRLVQAFEFIEPMPAAPICIVRRQGLYLTPMAEHLSDLMRNAARNYARRTAAS